MSAEPRTYASEAEARAAARATRALRLWHDPHVRSAGDAWIIVARQPASGPYCVMCGDGYMRELHA